MNQFKRAQVILLETSNNNFPNNTILKYSYSFGEKYSKLCYENCAIRTIHNYQHLYIISDDEIKDGDWYVNQDNKVFQSNGKLNKEAFIHCKKIIATTDTSLRIKAKNGVLGLMLPQPSQQFIEKYIESYNKGEIITDILVEYEQKRYVISSDTWGNHIIHKVNLKDNTITIKKLKDSWNRKEVICLMKNSFQKGIESQYNNWHENDFNLDKWIEKNL